MPRVDPPGSGSVDYRVVADPVVTCASLQRAKQSCAPAQTEGSSSRTPESGTARRRAPGVQRGGGAGGAYAYSSLGGDPRLTGG